MKITVAILDDDLFFVSVLEEKVRQILEKYGLVTSVDCFTNQEELVSGSKKYDLCFMDIVLPGQDGISLTDKLKEAGRVRDVIYVSAHDGGVFHIFGTRPISYVRKTYVDEDLDRAMALYHEHLKTMRVIIPEGKKMHLMRTDDIIYISSQNHYVEIHLLSGEKMVMRSKLDNMENIFRQYGFLRIHVSYLVNLKYVASLDRSHIYLKNREIYKISVKYKKQVFEAIKENFANIGNQDEVEY